ncbi:MAG TPA: hypothetical protein VK404_01450, partial [Spirosoma sp.]|nr:hypothetical protein [Spirosoma sp.]
MHEPIIGLEPTASADKPTGIVYVKPKKELGQHFLKDLDIAQRIASLLTGHAGSGEPYKDVLEIGP